jgi:hypothetical protein
MVAAAGAGPEPIPHKQLTDDNLVQAIEFCLTKEASIAAGTLSQKMQTEFGVQQAVDSFHANLPLSTLRCDILSDQPAAWLYTKGGAKVHLSKVAAQVLVDNGSATWSHLGHYEPCTIRTDVRRWDPASAVISSLMSTSTGMATSAADIIIKPIQAYQKPKTNAKGKEKDESFLASELNHKGTASETRSVMTPEKENPKPSGRFASAALGSASGVGRFFHHYAKGMLLDIPMAATEGLRAVPKLYGDEVPDRRQITDWKSGAIVAGTNFQEGIVGGFTDLVRAPIQGGREQGALGVAKGAGKGLVGMTTKVTSGAFFY